MWSRKKEMTKFFHSYRSVFRYLHTQIARAICKAAYEKPVTVEEISLYTGIPTMYIEDELPRLEYGDATQRVGDKYATDFFIFSLENRASLENAFGLQVKEIADYFVNLFEACTNEISQMGSIVVPYILRKKIRDIQENKLKLARGNYPPRKDGGYGWFIVEETATEEELMGEYATGCNSAGDDSGSRGSGKGHIYYYWMSKYFDPEIYHNGGIRWICANDIVDKCKDGRILEGMLSGEQLMCLMMKNLVARDDTGYRIYGRNHRICLGGIVYPRCPRKTGGGQAFCKWCVLCRRGVFGYLANSPSP